MRRIDKTVNKIRLEYIETHILRIKTYVLKDPIETLPQDHIKWRRYLLSSIFTSLYICAILNSSLNSTLKLGH
ncbi:fatty acyl-CoA reductase wat-like isoform X1 [Vespula squamosa]|uniref:Fatty acyl-CoA reductase wat-like isoform X1 n=1 Tax=Vespula squamosa TaxID=30214 RepID=A0ABD2BSA3_VESSQ